MAVVNKNPINGNYGSAYYLRLEYILNSQNIANNTSNITLKGYFYSASGYGFFGYNNTIALKTGTTQRASSTSNAQISTTPLQITTWTGNVSHNADGTLALTLGLDFTTAYPNLAATSFTQAWTLTTIPRTSQVSLSKTTFNIGETITVNTNRASSSFTHTAALTFGTFTKNIATGVGASTNWNTSIDAENMYAQMTAANSKTGTITLSTYSGTTLIGTSSVTFTADIIDANPLFASGNISFEDTNTTTRTLTGNPQKIIQGYSNIAISINTKATAQKAAILGNNAYVFMVTGQTTQYGNQSDSLPIIRTFNAMTQNQFTVGATDSRKNTTNNIISIQDFISYTIPAISRFVATRVNPNLIGTTIRLEFNGTYTNWQGLAVANTIVTARYRYRIAGGSYGSYINITLLTNTNGQFSFDSNITGTFTETESYEFEVQIIDRLAPTIRTAIAQSINPTAHYDIENRKMGIGKIASSSIDPGSMDVQGDVYSRGVKLGSVNINTIYPIGSIYLSVNSANPNTLFGGTWVAFAAGRTLIGIGNNGSTNYTTVEATGGSDNVVLTTANLASHTHTISSSGGHNHTTTTQEGGVYAASGTWTFVRPTGASGTANNVGTANTGTHTHTPASTGSGTAHENRPSYITCYMWKRTA